MGAPRYPQHQWNASSKRLFCFSISIGFDHRLQPNITAKGLIARSDPPKRPFVLTRSFYAGSQRFGAMWTGDNLGTWEHMTAGVQMVLANGIAGMTFGGCKLHKLWPDFSYLLLDVQLTWVVSLATLLVICWFVGTKSGLSNPSSARTHILTQSDVNLT